MPSNPKSGGHDLRVGEARTVALLDAALDAFVTIDHLGLIREFNLAAEATFGYRRDDVLGRELAELVIPEDAREAHRNALARWSQRGPSEPGAGRLLGRRIEVVAMRSDGSLFPAELSICRVDLPGAPLFTACVRDLTEKKRTEDRLRSVDFRYRTLVEQLPLISYVDSSFEPSAKAYYVSPQVENVLGYTVEEWLSEPDLFESSIHEDDRERVLAERREVYASGAELRCEYRIRSKRGDVVWLEDRSVLVEPPDGRPPFRQGFAIDITERKRAEDDLRRAEARYRTLVEQVPLAIYIDRLDEVSSNIYTSPQIETMLGYPVEEWVSNPNLFVETLHPDDRDWVLAAQPRSRSGGEPLQLEYRLIARDGRVVWVREEGRVIAGFDGGEPVLQGYLLDVTAAKEAEEQLRHQAFHDPLTGLANRALFTDRVEHALVLHGAAGQDVAVLYLDLDDFKTVNDTLGHAAGDALLEAVARRLTGVVSRGHTIARLGGDEFAVLVENVQGGPSAVEVAARLLASLEQPFELEGRELFVTASVGIAVGGAADELLRSADVAMYRAKAAGKSQYVVYVPRMDDDVVGRLELVAALRRASIQEEFVVHYQPTVELTSGTLVGVEALLRWHHPTRGLVPPLEFVPLAEETGTIVEIGRWVLEQACLQTARWRRTLPGAEGLEVSVNASIRQVRSPGLVEDVHHALDVSGLPPEALTLEITESVLAREEMTSILEEVGALGVRLALDDFGTGYSSLSLLQNLPVDTLKIDRSFIRRVDAAERRAFVRAIVDLARALELPVVAEGIEEPEQARELERLGCRLGQGFYFARPLDAASFESLFAAGAPARRDEGRPDVSKGSREAA